MTEQLNVRLSEEQLERIDERVRGGHYLNRQEFVREAIRRLLNSFPVETEEPEEAPEESPEITTADLNNCAHCSFAADCDSYSIMPDSRCERFEEKEAVA
jgi:Arc/MetJ-type ribon-helix-helix transcriptional regulator